MADAGRDYYTVDEVRTILARLSHADQVRLRRIAHNQARKVLGYNADELLTEGLTRVLDGVRHWPRGLNVATFMKNVFGSIISNEAKHYVYASKFEADTEVDISGDVDCAEKSVTPDSHPDPAAEIYAQEMLQRLMTALSDDQHALAVVMSMAEGLKATEAQSQFNMSAHQYDAARKRLKRKVEELTTEEVMV